MALPVQPPVRPMLAKALSALPDPADYPGGLAFEPKWDGFRALVFRDGDDVQLTSRNTRPMGRYFPEVADAVRRHLPPRCVVDGEIVVAVDGRLDFTRLQERLHPAKTRVDMLARTIPAQLVVFDLLALEDRSLLDEPFSARRAALQEALAHAGHPVHLTPLTTDVATARRWFEVFEGAGLDGVVAKPLELTYRPDTRLMLKVKHARTADVVVAGYRLHKESTDERPLLGSLLLGLYDDAGTLQHVGVAASFPMQRRAELVEELAPLVSDLSEHPWGRWAEHEQDARRPGAVSRWSAGKDLSFTPLDPVLVCEVRYDAMEGTRFRHTVQLKRWRPDREPGSCTYAQLERPVSMPLEQVLAADTSADDDGTGEQEEAR